jgi:hypothetical protein
MRDKTWHSMIAAKYKAIYLSYFNAFVRNGDRLLEAVVVITSSGGIGGWLVWVHIPYLWASMIGAAQIVKLLKPLLPFLKDMDDLADIYFFYEELHLEYEKLWMVLEVEGCTEEEITRRYFALRDHELEHQKKIRHFKVPRYKKLDKKTEADWKEYLRLNYQL